MASTWRLVPVRSTRPSRIDRTQSEHGLRPSTRAMKKVDASSDADPVSTDPMTGMSKTSAASPGSGSVGRTVDRIWLATASLKPTQTSSPMTVVGTAFASIPRAAIVSMDCSTLPGL